MLSENEITDLCNKYRTGELTREEFRKLKEWIQASEENREFFSNYVKLYKTGLRLKASHEASASEAWTNIERRCKRHKLQCRIYWCSAVACLLAVVMLTTYLFYPTAQLPAQDEKTGNLADIFPNLPRNRVMLTLSSGQQVVLDKDSLQFISDQGGVVANGTNNSLTYQATASPQTDTLAYNRISVPSGSVFSLILADGTKVVLNSSTTFRYPVNFRGDRVVEINGEAYFDVTRSGTPFIVKTPGREVRVLGTQFNVSAYEKRDMITTLVTGKVEIRSGAQRKRLVPGQQATIADASDDIAVEEVDTDIYTSWMSGRYDFQATPLQTILSQLELWYGVKMEYKDTCIRNIRFDGTVFRDRPLGFSLEIIQEVSDVEFTKHDHTIVVGLKKK